MVTYNVVVKYIINPFIIDVFIYICTQVTCFLTNYLCIFFYILKTNGVKFLLEKKRKKNPDEIGKQSKHV